MKLFSLKASAVAMIVSGIILSATVSTAVHNEQKYINRTVVLEVQDKWFENTKTGNQYYIAVRTREGTKIQVVSAWTYRTVDVHRTYRFSPTYSYFWGFASDILTKEALGGNSLIILGLFSRIIAFLIFILAVIINALVNIQQKQQH